MLSEDCLEGVDRNKAKWKHRDAELEEVLKEGACLVKWKLGGETNIFCKLDKCDINLEGYDFKFGQIGKMER